MGSHPGNLSSSVSINYIPMVVNPHFCIRGLRPMSGTVLGHLGLCSENIPLYYFELGYALKGRMLVYHIYLHGLSRRC